MFNPHLPQRGWVNSQGSKKIILFAHQKQQRKENQKDIQNKSKQPPRVSPFLPVTLAFLLVQYLSYEIMGSGSPVRMDLWIIQTSQHPPTDHMAKFPQLLVRCFLFQTHGGRFCSRNNNLYQDIVSYILILILILIPRLFKGFKKFSL